jgi:hypothetical protein
MKKKIITITFSLTLLLLLLVSIASASTVQACTSFSNKDNLPSQLMQSEIIAAAHWTENTPVAGGWIFATLAREPGQSNEAYLYVSGYHPFGAGTTFSGSDPDAKISFSGNILSVTTTINFAEVTGTNPVSYAQHDVTIQWTLPQIPKTHYGTYDWNSFCAKDKWSDTTASASINVAGTAPHADFSSSDWATIGILQPQKEAAIGHWIVNTPALGGWVFAATGKDDNRAKDTWLYVAGYHPVGAVGSAAALFEALSASGVQMNDAKNTLNIPTTTMNFNEFPPTASPVVHDISATWTANSQPRTHAEWKEANAEITINIHGAAEHNVLSDSSWAIADLQSFNCGR